MSHCSGRPGLPLAGVGSAPHALQYPGPPVLYHSGGRPFHLLLLCCIKWKRKHAHPLFGKILSCFASREESFLGKSTWRSMRLWNGKPPSGISTKIKTSGDVGELYKSQLLIERLLSQYLRASDCLVSRVSCFALTL